MLFHSTASICSTIICCSQASSTISVGFACFFFAWTVMAILSFGFPYSFSGNTAWKVLFGIFPWTILYRGYEIILSTDNQLRLLAFNGLLTIQTCMYTIFAFYFKGCLPDNEGKVTFPWYLVDFRRLYPKVRWEPLCIEHSNPMVYREPP